MAAPSAGQIVRASDAITFADAHPRVHAYDNAGNVCADGVAKVILFDSELYDGPQGTMHSTASNTSRLVAPIDGLYEIDIQVIMPTATYTAGLLNTRQNANAAAAGGTSLQNTSFVIAAAQTQPSPKTRFTRALLANDYVEFFVTQTSGVGTARTTIAGAYSTRAFMRYIASS